MALVCSEMDRAKRFERSPSSFLVEIKPHFTLGLKEQPRPPYAHCDFDKLRVDFPELGEHCPGPWTLTQVLMALFCSEMNTAKLFELVGRNIARVHFKNERIAETALRAS